MIVRWTFDNLVSVSWLYCDTITSVSCHYHDTIMSQLCHYHVIIRTPSCHYSVTITSLLCHHHVTVMLLSCHRCHCRVTSTCHLSLSGQCDVCVMPSHVFAMFVLTHISIVYRMSCAICNKTGSETEIPLCLQVLENIIKYYYLKSAALLPLCMTLSRTVLTETFGHRYVLASILRSWRTVLRSKPFFYLGTHVAIQGPTE